MRNSVEDFTDRAGAMPRFAARAAQAHGGALRMCEVGKIEPWSGLLPQESTDPVDSEDERS